jgi:hypothetical protein
MGKQLVSFITCGCELSAPFLYLQSRSRIGFHGQYSPSTPVSSTNKTDRHDITEMLLKVDLNTTNQQTNQLSILPFGIC